MADKPSRALVIYGDGFAPLVNDSHSNLHCLAALSSCGFLAVRSPQLPSEKDIDRETREFAQLLDAYDHYVSVKVQGESSGDQGLGNRSVPMISERFMGLKAALFTTGPSLGAFTRDLGVAVFETDELYLKVNGGQHKQKLTEGSSVAQPLLSLLGFSDGNVLEKSDFDLVFLHIKPDERVSVLKDKVVINIDTDWLNKLVGDILQMAQPKSEIASRFHLSLVLSYGTVDGKDNSSSTSISTTKMDSDLSLLRPRQSYTMKGGKLLDDVRNHHPMLVSQLQDAVTRRDMAQEFNFKQFKENGGNLSILADRFLHEVAFKLWKAPKYGA